MNINFLHKTDSTTITSRLLWDWSTVKDMDILFHALSIDGPDQKILTDASRGKACLIFKGEHGVQKVC